MAKLPIRFIYLLEVWRLVTEKLEDQNWESKILNPRKIQKTQLQGESEPVK